MKACLSVGGDRGRELEGEGTMKAWLSVLEGISTALERTTLLFQNSGHGYTHD